MTPAPVKVACARTSSNRAAVCACMRRIIGVCAIFGALGFSINYKRITELSVWLVAFHDCLYDEGAMYIVLEYMDGGSLADVLQAAQLTGSSALSEPVLARLAARVLGGLNYLHVDRRQVRANLTHPPTHLYQPT